MRSVLLQVEHRGNRTQLARWLATDESIRVFESPGEGGEIDVVIADGPGFARAREWLEAERLATRPLFLGCLLITPARDAGLITNDLWRSVDELVTTPLRQAELRVRIERLLMTRELSLSGERSRDELRRSNVDLERFAFVAAHELIAPLSVVLGGVATTRALLKDRVSETEAAVLDETLAGCRRMQTILEDILTYARADQPVRVEEVSVRQVVDEAIEDLGDRVAASGASITIAELPTVPGDAAQLRLVFRNLIGNAIKFARPGTTANVEVGASRENGHWLFSVADDGIGVPEDADVFGLFERGRDARRYSGSGIGLAICQRVVERHGGTIWHHPSEGNGSTFCFTLPAS